MCESASSAGRGKALVDDETGAVRRSPIALAIIGLALTAVLATLLALGTWQVHRLSWKLALIDAVDRRVHAPPALAPGPSAWGAVTAASDEYRHVQVSGTLQNDRETLVQATTELGAGFWVLTPLRVADGTIVLVNRGFVPPSRRDPSSRVAGQNAGSVTIVGLLRLTEPKGGFLRTNDPAAHRFYSRDVAAIAGAQGLTRVAPFFIDADATPNDGGYPVGGLTVVSFPNNHLVYAVTWYALAAMLAGAIIWFVRDEWRLRHALSADLRPSQTSPGQA